MTHGHFVIKDQEGREINLYTYHDGHTEELIDSLRALPTALAHRHHMKDMVQHCEGKADFHQSVGRIFHPPALDFLPEFATAFVQCHPNVCQWAIYPSEFKEDMIYPGPDVTVVVDRDSYSIKWEDEDKEHSETVPWRFVFIEKSYQLGKDIKDAKTARTAGETRDQRISSGTE